MTDSQTGKPIGGATINVIDNNSTTVASTKTNPDGTYSTPSISNLGTFYYGVWVYPQKDYETASCSVTITPGAVKTCDFTLVSTVPGTITGKVADKQTGSPLAGATVLFGSAPLPRRVPTAYIASLSLPASGAAMFLDKAMRQTARAVSRWSRRPRRPSILLSPRPCLEP